MFKLPRRLPAGSYNLHPTLAATRAGTHTQTGDRLCADRTFSHFNFTVSGFCHQYGNKKWMKMMKIKPQLLGSGDWERRQNEAWHHAVLSFALQLIACLYLFSLRLVFNFLSFLLQEEKEAFALKLSFYWQRGLCGDWGPSEGLPKKCLTE